MNAIPQFHRFSDSQLIDAMPELVRTECSATAVVVAGLMEFDARRLFLPLGYPSLFQYCVRELKLTEDATFNRVEAARAARRFPRVLELLHSGELSLTAVRLLAPHLTNGNCTATLESARHKTKRELEVLIAKMRPQPPVPSVVRKLPEPKVVSPAETAEAPPMSLAELLDAAPPPPSRRPIVAPLSEAHYKLQVTISAAARERLLQIQSLMRHRIPSGDPAAIEAKGRYIPASVKREVWRRDEGRCAFVARDGRKCGSTDGVEFHHVQPYAVGGEATVDNLEMRCRAHNGFEWTRHLDSESESLDVE